MAMRVSRANLGAHAVDEDSLGTCHICGKPVGKHAGNIQYRRDGKVVTHDSCARNGIDGFSMIKFIK
jgi:hypothetical protein